MSVNTAIGDLLSRRASIDADARAVVTPGERLTFGELDRRARRIAALLEGAGLRKGDRVAVLGRNSAGYLSIYYGVAKLGAIMCGLNFRLAAPELAYIIRDSGARLLIVDPEFADLARDIVSEARPELTWIGGEREICGFAPVAPLLASMDVEPSFASRAAPEDPLLLVYTSGTTGRPKGAVLTHAGMFWASATMAFSLDFRRGDVNLIPVPFFHVGGLSFATLFVHVGATAVVPPAWDPRTALELIEAERVNHFFAVAAMLRGLLDEPRLDSADLSSLRWILAGGAPVSPALIEAFAQRRVPVQQTYGATETAGPATFVDLAHATSKAGSVGLPFFHTDVKVADDGGGEVAPNRVGEILIRAAHLVARYWQNPEATAQAFDRGWFRTGDLGYRDGDGYLYIVDRRKDLIISGGENVYPAEIEGLLEQHPDIVEAAVFGVPDQRWGEVPCAVVVTRGDVNLTLAQVADYCQGKIARYKIPKRLVARTTPLPRNSTGKLLKHVLRTELEDPDSGSGAVRPSAATP